MLWCKILFVVPLILSSSAIFHHNRKVISKAHIFSRHHHPHSWTTLNYHGKGDSNQKYWFHDFFNHHHQDYDDTEHTQPKIDIRWDSDQHTIKSNLKGLVGCKFSSEDFDREKKVRETNICSQNEETLIIREISQGWCFGFYNAESLKQRNTLDITVDRAYRIQYAPTIHVERFSSYEIRFNFLPKKIYSIILSENGRGVPIINSLKLNGNDICNSPNHKQEVSTDSQPQPEIPKVIHPQPTNQQNRWKKNSCGTRRVIHSQLISSGIAARPGDWPWHAAIYHATGTNFKYKCGGNLISHGAVLTAAHCVLENGNQIIPERVKVQLGKYHLYVSDPHSKDVLVFNIIVHPNFDPESSKHDIAILKLAVRVTFSNQILPVCLPDDPKFDLTNQMGTIIGWGRNEAGELPAVLHQAPMIIPSQLECLESNRDFFGYFLNDANFCAGYRNGTTACAGDSGGGLFIQHNGQWVLRGIVSIAVRGDIDSGCQTDHYVLFTNVAKHLDWIHNSMGRF